MKENKKIKSTSGITLVALVVTVIVLIILAAVTINLLLGTNGIITRSQEATKNYQKAEQDEQEGLLNLEEEMEELIGSSSEAKKDMITKWNITSGTEVSITYYSIYMTDRNGTSVPDNSNFTIDWGDGAVEEITPGAPADEIMGTIAVTHTYATTNPETLITISGECVKFEVLFNSALIEVVQWGETGLVNLAVAGSGIKKVASPTKDSFKDITNFSQSFYDCAQLETIPSDLFKGCTDVKDFYQTFYGCTLLKEIPEDLFKDCINAEDFGETFSKCKDLTSIPLTLFDNCTKVTKFRETFYDCTELTGAKPELWTRVPDGASNGYIGIPNGQGCYMNCTKLDNYTLIPSHWRGGPSGT